MILVRKIYAERLQKEELYLLVSMSIFKYFCMSRSTFEEISLINSYIILEVIEI